MENKLAQNFTITSLLKFTAPTCIMLVFMSLYQMTDAVFVSNFVGENALSALNIVFPIPSIIIGNCHHAGNWRKCHYCEKHGRGRT